MQEPHAVDNSAILSAIDQLVRQWRPLTFIPKQDQQLAGSDTLNAYLSYYGLDKLPAAKHGFGFLNVSGDRVCTQYWMPEKPYGKLFLVHGYYDHVGLYRHAIEFGLRHNMAVVAFDLPGHGLSDGERATVDDFEHYTAALADVFEQAKKLPVAGPNVGLAQSTGCAVLLKYQLDRASWFQAEATFTAQIFLAPLVRPKGWKFGRFAHWLVSPFMASLRRVFSQNSHDEDFLELIQRDPLQPRILSLRWVSAMKRWIEQAEHASCLDVPSLMIQGNEDHTVDWRYNVPLLCTKLPRHHIYWLNSGMHQLINESPELRAEYMAVADSFVDSFLHVRKPHEAA